MLGSVPEVRTIRPPTAGPLTQASNHAQETPSTSTTQCVWPRRDRPAGRRVELEAPRARLNTPDGKTTEWKSKALRAYQRRTLVADALIAGAYLAGTNTRRVRRALAALLPAGEPHVRHARGVVGVIVGKKLHIDSADRKLELAGWWRRGRRRSENFWSPASTKVQGPHGDMCRAPQCGQSSSQVALQSSCQVPPHSLHL